MGLRLARLGALYLAFLQFQIHLSVTSQGRLFEHLLISCFSFQNGT